MPPTSTTIFEEGANVESFKIVSDGIFDKKGLDRYMIEIPASYPGSSGCRNIRDVESDLKAVRSPTQCLMPQLIHPPANRGEP
jgi:5-oxoprolinase (ATP-hydrolysing)